MPILDRCEGRTFALIFLVAVGGGTLIGALLSAYWWDFGPYEEFSIFSPRATVILYAMVGGFTGFMCIGPLMGVVLLVGALRKPVERRPPDPSP